MAVAKALAGAFEEVARGPQPGASPPKHRVRMDTEEDEMKAQGLDSTQFAMARFLTKQIQTAAMDQEEKFEGRFDKLEVKMQTMAKATDAGIKEVGTNTSALEKELVSVKVELKEMKSEGIAKLVKETMASEFPGLTGHDSGAGKGFGAAAGGGKGFGKAKGKAAKREDEKNRTITFGNFSAETQEDDIIQMIEGKVESMREDIEEVFAYAKTGTRGAAKFFSQDAMWKYMVDKKGQHTHEYKGTTIYVNAPTCMQDPDGAAKDKAVRKMVRVLIEQNGGDGPTVKKRIDAKYKVGIVWWKGDDNKWNKVAEWKKEEAKMILMPGASQLQGPFDVLMG